MKTPFILAAFLVLSTSTVQAQDICSALSFPSIKWTAVSAVNRVEVVVVRQGTNDVFSPRFVLFNMQGDTLAYQEVSVSGFSNEPYSHILTTTSAVIPDGPFPAHLVLYGGSPGSEMCSWDMEIDLCPTDPCTTLLPYTFSQGANSTTVPISWSIVDGSGTLYANGTLTLGPSPWLAYGTSCLPVGEYILQASTPATLTVNTWIGVRPEWYPNAGMGIALQGNGVMNSFPFTHFPPCLDLVTAVTGPALPLVQALFSDGRLAIRSLDDGPLGRYEVMDALGRSLVAGRSMNTSTSIDGQRFSAGVVLVRVVRPDGSAWVQRLAVP